MTRALGLPARRAGAAWRLAAALALLVALLAGTFGIPAQALAATTTLTFDYTGAAQTWTVPTGVTSATFDVYGAQGGGSPYQTGGLGGRAQVTLTVTPGATYQIVVGGRGASRSLDNASVGGPGGFNGGAVGGQGFISGSGGGGASDVRSGAFALADRLVVAGGGGGSSWGIANGGGGGGNSGANGPCDTVDGSVCGGGGGTQAAGGAGVAGDGTGGLAGAAGTLGNGGAGGAHIQEGGGGGGGGGGYYGGGGGGGHYGGRSGGGGGSGFGPAGVQFTTGVRPGNGQVLVTYTKLDQTITFNALGGKTYGDVPFAVSATASSGLTVTFTASGNCSVAGTTVTITGAGSCAVTAHQAGNEGYDAAPDVSRTFSIAKASLSVTAQNATRPFGSSAVPCTVQFAGFVNGDGAGVVSGSATCTTTAAANSPAGQYPLIPAVGTLSATNYTFGPFVNGTLTIAQAATSLDSVRGTVTYGDTIGSVTARLTTSGGGPLPGATVSFTVNGNPAGSATTNAQGVASLSGVTFPAGLNAGTNSNIQICATFAGANDYLGTGPTCGPLVVGRRVLWIKPTDRTVGLKQPNPPADAHGDPACLAPSYCLELTRGSTFVAGQSWSALNLTNLRFQYARNPPSTNATEYVGKTYRMTAFGAISSNYDLRYDPGTMTVVAAP